MVCLVQIFHEKVLLWNVRSESMHQFVSIKFSCLIESNVSSVWHWVMSHCCDISDIWPIRGQYCVPLTNKKPDNEMNGLRCCDSLDRPVVTMVSLTMDPGEIKGAAPGPHTSPDVTAREDHTLLWSQLSHQHQDTGHYGARVTILILLEASQDLVTSTLHWG